MVNDGSATVMLAAIWRCSRSQQCLWQCGAAAASTRLVKQRGRRRRDHRIERQRHERSGPTLAAMQRNPRPGFVRPIITGAGSA
jgi:hypothetical protein